VPVLDYYLIHSDGELDGVLVEEFAFAPDDTTLGLACTAWTRRRNTWWSDERFSREARTDPAKAAALRTVDRAAADEAFGSLVGHPLHDEEILRGCFRDYVRLPAATPLVLGAEPTRRIHRVLLAGDVQEPERLCVALTLVQGTANGGIVGVAHRGEAVSWCLRRIGGGLAWCVDVTSPADHTGLRAHLHRLMTIVRAHGFLPVTVERLA
jgi:hypothetical protein